MELSRIITLFTGGLAILFTYWFFFGKKEEMVESDGSELNIKVDAGYSPSTVVLKKGNPVTLKIKRLDSSSCLEEIIIPKFGIKKFLPLNEEVNVRLDPEETGEFPFHCGMNMFHGKIIVK